MTTSAAEKPGNVKKVHWSDWSHFHFILSVKPVKAAFVNLPFYSDQSEVDSFF